MVSVRILPLHHSNQAIPVTPLTEIVMNFGAALEIKKIKRSFCIVAGASIIGKFRTLEAARKDLKKNPGFYEYWAGSASVSVDNSDPIILSA